MNKYEVRRRQLQLLVNEYGDGFMARFARRVGMHPARIGHFLYPLESSSNRLITERSTEIIEKALGLESGWFDRPLMNKVIWPFKSITYKQYLSLKEQDRQEFEAILRAKLELNKQSIDNEKN